jgi:P27 family predicted phage terminase small subunit
MDRRSNIRPPDEVAKSLSPEANPTGAVIDQEPAAVAPIIECPPELDGAAHREWDRIIADLSATGAVCTLDRAALAVYCQAYSIWIEAVENLKRFGTVMKSPSGYPVQSPYLSIANQQVDIMLRIAAQFGFTPASRGQKIWIANNDSELIEGDEDLKALGDMSELPKLKW